MKKLSTILVAMLFSVITFAQQNGADALMTSLDSSKTTSHVVNTGARTMLYKVTNGWDVVSVQMVETKLSGTVAGTAILVGSNDGINFVNICRPSVAASSLQLRTTDSLTSSDVTTNTKIWTWSNKNDAMGNPTVCFPYKYIGFKKTGSGTMESVISGNISVRHK